VKNLGEGHYYKNQNIKTKKNIEKFGNHHYIESGFLVDHYYDITTASLHQKSVFF
jgi:hypothetical protein